MLSSITIYHYIMISLFFLLSYMQGLQQTGRLNNPRLEGETQDKTRASKLIEQGWLEKIQWESEWCCLVPSSSQPELLHKVDLILLICSCNHACMGSTLHFLCIWKQCTVYKIELFIIFKTSKPVSQHLGNRTFSLQDCANICILLSFEQAKEMLMFQD